MYNTVNTELCFMRQKRNGCIEKTYPMTVDFKVQVKNIKGLSFSENQMYVVGQFNYVLLLSVCDTYMTPINTVSKSLID